MKENGKRVLAAGIALLLAFAVWTALVRTVDVQTVPVRSLEADRTEEGETDVGFASLNTQFHELTGEHEKIYSVTDWLGLVPIAVCGCFGILGLVQLIRRRSLKKVDPDILLLGAYYILVILGYIAFEMIPVNCRPVIIAGAKEASYPSSTTLLVLSVIPTLIFQANRRMANAGLRNAVIVLAALFATFMTAGRTIAGVHWLTDIIGAVLLSAGLYLVYRATVMIADGKKAEAGRE